MFTRAAKVTKVSSSGALREKEEGGDLSEETQGVVTRARKRRMVENSVARNIDKEVRM